MKINKIAQSTFNKVAGTIENSKSAQKASQRIMNYSKKIANHSNGEFVDVLAIGTKTVLEVPRTLFGTLFEIIKNIVTK